jgi:hypothetical protein
MADDLTRQSKPTRAEKTAADWIRPSGGYDQYRKGDAERERRLPPGGRYSGDYGRTVGTPRTSKGKRGSRRGGSGR